MNQTFSSSLSFLLPSTTSIATDSDKINKVVADPECWQNTVTILSLPKDAVENYIWRRLYDPKDLFSIASVCKQWSNWIQDDGFPTLFLNPILVPLNCKTFMLLAKRIPFVRKLTLSLVAFDNYFSLHEFEGLPQLLFQYAPHLSELRFLKCGHISPQDSLFVGVVLERCKRLHALQLQEVCLTRALENQIFHLPLLSLNLDVDREEERYYQEQSGNMKDDHPFSLPPGLQVLVFHKLRGQWKVRSAVFG